MSTIQCQCPDCVGSRPNVAWRPEVFRRLRPLFALPGHDTSRRVVFLVAGPYFLYRPFPALRVLASRTASPASLNSYQAAWNIHNINHRPCYTSPGRQLPLLIYLRCCYIHFGLLCRRCWCVPQLESLPGYAISYIFQKHYRAGSSKLPSHKDIDL